MAKAPRPYDIMAEEVRRWRSRDQEGLRRFVDAMEDEYRKRVDDWVQAPPETLAKLQGAALALREHLEFFKYQLTVS
ncbi:MAG TPA: hypothetical protein VNG33_17785 [Polyangiaceae bacterium]|nr:hypothetical protein [Polyangiaceae bacterium]